MNTKHTSATWVAELATPDEYAHVYSSVESPIYPAICTVIGGNTVEEQNHNALLIAAAPELLTILEDVKRYLLDPPYDTQGNHRSALLLNVSKILKKAKGE